MYNDDLLMEYKKIIQDNQYNNMTRIYCLYCIDETLKWLEKDLIVSDDEKMEMASAVYDNWMDTDIQISKISDIIGEHWEEYKDNDDFNIYDYIDF